MSRRSVAVMLCFAMFVSTNVVSGVAAQSVDLATAQLAAPLGTEPVARVGLDSVAAFDPTGGWAAVDPATTTGELLYYRGLDALSNELTGVSRFAAQAHDAGVPVAPLEASDLVAAAGAPIDASATLSDLGTLEAIIVDAVESFASSGVALATTATGVELFYFASTDTASSALTDIGGVDPTALSTTTSVSTVDPTTLFPLVVDPPPVTVSVVDPSPITIDPSPVGPYTIEPLDPSPIAVVGPDPDPVIADPPPIVQPGIDPDPVATDPPPIYIDGPDPAPVIADPPPVHKPGIDPAPVVADPPPVYVDGPDPAPVIADPPPYVIGIDDPAPIYLDPPGYVVSGTDPPPVGYDAPPVAVAVADPPPVGGSYVNPPNPGTVSYDAPGAGGTYVNPPNPGTISYDPPPLGGGYVVLPDTDPLCVDPAAVENLIADLIGGINVTLPPIAMSSTVICIDPADGQIIPIPSVDAPPVSVTVPDPCPGTSGCYVPKVDPSPVSVTVPDPCPGTSGCYIPQVDLAPPPPLYLDPTPVSVDLAPIPAITVNPAPISYDVAPLPGASGDPAPVSVDPPAVPDVNVDLAPVGVDLQPIPGVSQDPAEVVIDVQPLPDVSNDPAPVGVDLQPLPGASLDPAAVVVDPTPVEVMVDPPALCSGGPDPMNPSCTIPAVDAPPVTVDVPGVCAATTGVCGTHDPAPVATIDPSSPPCEISVTSAAGCHELVNTIIAVVCEGLSVDECAQAPIQQVLSIVCPVGLSSCAEEAATAALAVVEEICPAFACLSLLPVNPLELAGFDCPVGLGPFEASTIPQVIPAECNLIGKTIADGEALAVVQEPGSMVWTEAIVDIGVFGAAGDELLLTTLPNGIVIISHSGSEAESATAETPTSDHEDSPDPIGNEACDRMKFDTYDFTESHVHEWWLNIDSGPSYLPRDGMIDAVRDGGRNITHEFNDCGRADNVTAQANYLGETQRTADFNNEGGCQNERNRDGHNVVDFGYLPVRKSGAVVYGRACNHTTFYGQELTESDIRITILDRLTLDDNADDINSACNAYDDEVEPLHLEALMTHERGHTFGLAHVEDRADRHQTMYYKFRRCNPAPRTLGKGDMVGLETKYAANPYRGW